MENDKSKRSRIGFVRHVAWPSLDKQKEDLQNQECSKIYDNWNMIKPVFDKFDKNTNPILRTGDTLFLYDLWILGTTEKVMYERLDLLYKADINVQIAKEDVDKVFPIKYTKGMYRGLRRAKRNFSYKQTLAAHKARASQPRVLKMDEVKFQKVFSGWLAKVNGSSNERIVDICKRLGIDTRAFYSYLDRYIVQLANKEWEYPVKIPKNIWNSVLTLRKIAYSKEMGRYATLKDIEKNRIMIKEAKKRLKNKN